MDTDNTPYRRRKISETSRAMERRRSAKKAIAKEKRLLERIAEVKRLQRTENKTIRQALAIVGMGTATYNEHEDKVP